MAQLKQATMQESDLLSPRPEKTLAYGGALTFAEYLAESHHRDFLEMRGREIRLLPDDQLYFALYPDVGHWLVVVADDSPETLVVLPVLTRVADHAPRLTLRVVREEDAPELLGVLADEGVALLQDADLPLLFCFDEEWHFQETWGPHPQAFDPLWERWLGEHPAFETLAEDESPAGHAEYARLVEQLLYAQRLWYNSGLNHAVAQELHQLLARWHDESADDGVEGDEG
jgi:hypothetical protein